MSAGTGIMHSEYNHSQEKPVHLLQLWIFPRTRGLKPHWEQRVFPRVARAGRLLPVVTGSGLPGTLAIDQDAQIYVSTLESGQAVIHKTSPDRRAYLFAIEGNLTINGALLAKGDQARISGEALLKIHAEENCDLILLDLPEIREEPY